jgi:hypothetical protein
LVVVVVVVAVVVFSLLLHSQKVKSASGRRYVPAGLDLNCFKAFIVSGGGGGGGGGGGSGSGSGGGGGDRRPQGANGGGGNCFACGEEGHWYERVKQRPQERKREGGEGGVLGRCGREGYR